MATVPGGPPGIETSRASARSSLWSDAFVCDPAAAGTRTARTRAALAKTRERIVEIILRNARIEQVGTDAAALALQCLEHLHHRLRGRGAQPPPELPLVLVAGVLDPLLPERLDVVGAQPVVGGDVRHR